MSARHVLITGGSRGIGRATTLLFLREGFRVSMVSRSPIEGEIPAEDRRRYGWCRGDLTELGSFAGLISDACGQAGPIDHLVLNAGQIERFHLADATEEAFDRLMTVNFKGPYFFLQRALAAMRDGGSIALVSSISASVGFAGASAYAASKAALSSLCRSLAPELVPRSITINAAHFGAIATGMIDGARAEKMKRSIPLGRIGEREEAAGLLLFLCQPAARYMSGQSIHLDGGIGQFCVE